MQMESHKIFVRMMSMLRWVRPLRSSLVRGYLPIKPHALSLSRISFPASPPPPRFALGLRMASSLKHGEFIGSLDCGTTYIPPLVFWIPLTRKSPDRSGSSSSISTRTSSRNTRSSFRNTTLIQGKSLSLPSLEALLIHGCRWHDHDAVEIQDHSNKCIEEATAELEKAGWAKESIKVIGMFRRHHMIMTT